MATPRPRNTTLWDWLPLFPYEGFLKGYGQLLIALFLYLTVPIVVAGILNSVGMRDAVMLVLVLTTVIDVWIILRPIPLLGVTALGFVRGQFGGSAGPSTTDGARTAVEWVTTYVTVLGAVLVAKVIALLLLSFVSVKGNGWVLGFILALLIPVIVGSLVYSKSRLVLKAFWITYVILLVGAVLYWVIVSINPDLRQSEAAAFIEDAQETVRLQNDQALKTAAKEVLKTINEMKPESLTLNERIAALTPEQRRIWKEAQEATFTKRSVGAGSEVAKSAASATAGLAKKGGQVAASGFSELRDWFWGVDASRPYTLTSLTQPQEICGLEAGVKYRYATPSKLPVRNLESGRFSEVNLAGSVIDTRGHKLPYGGMQHAWALVLNGSLPGNEVQADRQGCLAVAINLTPPLAAAYQIANASGEVVRLDLHRDGEWTWRGAATLALIIVIFSALIWGIKWVFRKK